MQASEFEWEARRRLPTILAELLDELNEPSLAIKTWQGDGVDFLMTTRGRRWAIEAKTSSSPGVVAAAAKQLAALPDVNVIPLLVVPYMTPAGAKAANGRRLNWVDLSGNANLRDGALYVSVLGRPNQFIRPGRTSSAFAPRSSRVTRALLLDPARWWLQRDLVAHTGLNQSQVSRVVHRLADDELLRREGQRLQPHDPDLLLDAWADAYRFDRHDILIGHLTGSGIELAREISDHLDDHKIAHAFTGLPAAWVINQFARFRLITVYIDKPAAAAEVLALRRGERGANVQLVGPDDPGVFDGQATIDGLPCVAPIQTYLDLLHLPERAREAARHLHDDHLLWPDRRSPNARS